MRRIVKMRAAITALANAHRHLSQDRHCERRNPGLSKRLWIATLAMTQRGWRLQIHRRLSSRAGLVTPTPDPSPQEGEGSSPPLLWDLESIRQQKRGGGFL